MTSFKRALAALAVVLTPAAAQAVTVDITLDRMTVAPGDTFTATLSTSADTPAIGGFQSVLSFDAAVLEEVSATVNPIFTVADTTPGGIGGTDFGFILNPSTAPRGALTLGSVTFRALASGSSNIRFTAPGIDGILTDPEGRPIVLGPIVTSITAEAPVVPLPASVVLLFGAFGSLLALRRIEP